MATMDDFYFPELMDPPSPSSGDRWATTETPLSAILPAEDIENMHTLGLETVGDFLAYYPRRWAERGDYADINDCLDGETVTTGFTVEETYLGTLRNSARKKLTVKGFTDERRPLTLTFFNPWQARRELQPGTHITVSGELATFGRHRALKRPEYAISGHLLDRPVRTVYPAKKAIPAEWIETRNEPILDALNPLPEHLPETVVERRGFQSYDEAARNMHLPESVEEAEAARRRLAYDEALATQLVLAARRLGSASAVARAFPHRPGGVRDAYDSSLPYTLTEGQQEAGTRIERTLSGNTPMNALVLGDVGSGKTLVANRALLQVVDSGAQGAFIAPTEVLAEQHYKGLCEDLADVDVKVGLLVGSLTGPERKQRLAGIKNGDYDIVVGTHAVLSESVVFKNLGLVVIDEQHRFGVEQRDKLRTRGQITPHMLVMTATPIPRTIAMTVYGDLETYELAGVPAGRKPISTTVVPTEKTSWVQRAWAVMAEQITQGRQVFLVAALIDDVETTETYAGQSAYIDYSWAAWVQFDSSALPEGWEAVLGEDQILRVTPPESARTNSSGKVEVTTTVEPDANDQDQIMETTTIKVKVRKQPTGDEKNDVARPAPVTVHALAAEAKANLPAARIGVLHGKMHPDHKNRVMAQFAAGELDVLVSTTVIEVGVNVPNATVMCLWDADRFGAAQLHQLRGRVGRGEHEGTCLLVTTAGEDHPSRERLEQVASTTNGFEIAKIDLENRKEGDILGSGQSGKSRMKLLDLLSATRLIAHAREDAQEIIVADPALRQHPELRSWLETMLTEEEQAAITRA